MSLKLFAAPILVGVAASAATLAGMSAFERPAIANTRDAADTDLAYIDLYGLLEQKLRAEDLLAAREDAVAPLSQQLQQSQQRIQQLAAQIQGQGVESPESEPLILEFQQLQQTIQQLNQEVNAQITEVYSGQMQAAHQEIMSAADEVAAEAGFSMVIASRAPERMLERGPVDVMVQELLARPVVRAPSSVDLTAKVRERLGLPDPATVQQPMNDMPAIEGPGAPASVTGEGE